MLFLGLAHGALIVFEVETCEFVGELYRSDSQIGSIDLTIDGTFLIAGTYGNSVAVVDIMSSEVSEFQVGSKLLCGISDVAVCAEFFIVTNGCGYIYLFDSVGHNAETKLIKKVNDDPDIFGTEI